MLAVSIKPLLLKAIIVVTTMLKMKVLCNNKLYRARACRYMQASYHMRKSFSHEWSCSVEACIDLTMQLYRQCSQ